MLLLSARSRTVLLQMIIIHVLCSRLLWWLESNDLIYSSITAGASSVNSVRFNLLSPLVSDISQFDARPSYVFSDEKESEAVDILR